jgi:hypothetical protein
MQELRSQNAASALESQGNQLELARSAQLAGITSKDGLTRAEIEKKIKDAKKEIAIIEGGSLKTAQDAIKAAEEKLQKDILGLSYAGQTKAQWDLQSAAIGAAETKAIAFNSKAKDVLKTVTDIVAQWNALGTAPTPPAPKLPVVPPKPAPGKNAVPKAGGGSIPLFASGGKVGYYPMGGLIPYMADGGMFQSVNTDTVPAMLTPGEFVVRRSAVDKFGLQNLKNINNGTYGNTLSRGFNQPVYPEISRDYASANIGGGIYPSSDVPQSNTQVDNSVYNYSLSVNVEGTDASPDQIANVVMRKLQDFGSQRVRGQVVR